MADVHLTSALDDAAANEIEQRLVTFNLAHTMAQPAAPEEPRPLHLFAYDDTGALVGGLIGRTHSIPFWLEVSILWVDEAHRRQGLGQRLVEECEWEATRRGCHYARLATSDYQAPEFYAKLGYIRYGMLDNCPPGETVFYFCKPLPATDAR